MEGIHGLLYAVGGGRGHVQRALNLAEGFEQATILHSFEGPMPFPDWVRSVVVSSADTRADVAALIESHRRPDSTLVVDTFPWGVGRRLGGALVSSFARRVLVARYVRPGSYEGYEEALEAFPSVWLPTERDACEWEGWVEGTYIGAQVRTIAMGRRIPVPLLVIGDTNELPPAFASRFGEGTHFIHGSFEALPAAERVLSVGAGYNIVHELGALGVNARFFPLERRYDNQFLRAARWGQAVLSADELDAWLRSDTPSVGRV